MKAKKSFGQHFLNREDIAQRIAHSFSRLPECSFLLEIGPGQGMLTKYLLELDIPLRMVEADQDMVQYLRKYYPELKEQILFEDFLKLDFEHHFQDQSFGLIGNFPYNISSQIIFKMLDHKEQVPELVGMFQKEMAERVVADPGSKTYGAISVLTQAFYEGTYLFTVDKSAFSPPPKVQSGVIRLSRKKELNLGCNVSLFKDIVRRTFNQRRKMLRNTLKAFTSDPEILGLPQFTKRPEVLSVADFIELTNLIEQANQKT